MWNTVLPHARRGSGRTAFLIGALAAGTVLALGAQEPRRSPAGGGRDGGTAAPTAGVPAPLAALLKEIRDKDHGQLAVSEEDGRFLRVLIAASGSRRALEIGGASGYSAIWMGLALRDTGGRLVTIEYDAGRARELAANIARAGLSDIVTVVPGDAFKEIPKVQGTFDFVFLDAWKRDYRRFFDLVFPRLEKGGLFVGHNVVNKRNELEDFLTVVEGHPDLFTTIVSPSGEGMSVSFRRSSR
jgi:predicted O-methyltransferase YrrM